MPDKPDKPEVLLSTRKFRVERRAGTTPGGKPFERAVVVHPNAAVILPLLDEDTVVLIRNYRQSVGETLLELPAGTLDADETPESCARRELIEETGYRAERWEAFDAFFASPGTMTERLFVFVARDLTHVGQNLDAGEEIAVEPVALDRIRQFLRDGTLQDGKTIAVLARFLLMRG
ncbi:MAG TPA: NUDIX hydrolase [Phycisphaerae bacterium]|nr:NUDIX hydrolase [Phycisphaerae bacterium]